MISCKWTHKISKILFNLCSCEYIARLESKIRKCLFFDSLLLQKYCVKNLFLPFYIMKYWYFKQFPFTDSFKVSGTSGLSTPIICGSNAGQHSKFAFNENIANHSRRVFLLRQIWTIYYLHQKSCQKFSAMKLKK